MKKIISTLALVLVYASILNAQETSNILTPSPTAAPSVTPIPTSSPNTTSSPTPEATIAATEEESVPYPQTVKPQPSKPAAPRKPPKTYGDTSGKAWIGQRTTTARHAGWGWIKEEGANWLSAKWIMIEEKPGKIMAPQRFYPSPDADDGVKYKLYGEFADYKGYEPNVDTLVDVFVIRGFEVIGAGDKITRTPPGSSGSGRGRISEREPMQLRR